MNKFLFLLYLSLILITSCINNSEQNNNGKNQPLIYNNVIKYLELTELSDTKLNIENYESELFNLYTNDFFNYQSEIIIIYLEKDSIILKNNEGIPFDENRITYSYLGYSFFLNKHLVKVNAYENKFFLLINNENGNTDTLLSNPLLSIDKNMLFSFSYNPYQQYLQYEEPTTDFQILELKDKNISSRTPCKPIIADIDFSLWISENEIALIKDSNITHKVKVFNEIDKRWKGQYSNKDNNLILSITMENAILYENDETISLFPISIDNTLELYSQGNSKFLDCKIDLLKVIFKFEDNKFFYKKNISSSIWHELYVIQKY